MINEVETKQDGIPPKPVNGGGFLVQPINLCIEEAQKEPPIKTLYPDIVLEGDLCVIFGQSGIGKTVFAMQIARFIAESGKRVLYVDCEMTPRQLALRYETPNFPPTLLRAQMDAEHPVEDVLKGIEEVAAANMVEVVFIDNISALGQSLDRSTDAGNLMASLNTLKKNIIGPSLFLIIFQRCFLETNLLRFQPCKDQPR